jgi:hypothetical protein
VAAGVPVGETPLPRSDGVLTGGLSGVSPLEDNNTIAQRVALGSCHETGLELAGEDADTM